jgi:hypothetical protein
MSPPGGLRPGEQVLRFLVPSGWDAVPALRRTLFHLILIGGGGTLLSVCAGVLGGMLHNLLGLFLGLAGFGLSFVLAIGISIWRRPKATRWWVTTRRLIVKVGEELQEFELDALESVQASASLDELQLEVGGESITVGPVNFLGELWGAVLFGRAWNAPPIELSDTVQTDDNSFRWAFEHATLKKTRGLLSMRPDRIAWLPEQVLMTGSRAALQLVALVSDTNIRRVDALPPLERFAGLLRFGTDPELFDRECERAARAWGGWALPPNEVDWSFAPDGTLTVEREGRRIVCSKLPADDVASLKGLWGVADSPDGP